MPDISRRLDKAEKLLQKGKLEAALDEYLEALQEDPHNDVVRDSAADLCATLHRDSEAAHLLAEIFEHQVQTGEASKALITYKKLARHKTPTTDQTLRYAQFCERTNKHEALECYHSALAALTKAGRNADAMKVMQRIVALDPTADNYRKEGELAAELGMMDAASVAFVNLAILLENHGEDPAEAYSTAFALYPSNAGAALGHGRCLLAHGNADEAIKILQPLASYPSAPVEARDAYGLALLTGKRLTDAQPFIWEMYERNTKSVAAVYKLIGDLLDANDTARALTLAKKLEDHQRKAGLWRDYLSHIKEIFSSKNADIAILEYMAELYNSNNREADYCATLLQLFELYYASGKYPKACDCLDRAAEIDPYEPGHQTRLDMLRGKVDTNRFNTLAGRFTTVMKTPEERDPRPGDKESTVLEDLMLQAEIFLQYSMRSKAVERLDRIAKLFPGEEQNSEKLRQLFENAGMPLPGGNVSRPPVTNGQAQRGVPQAVANEGSVDNISRVTEITRNIYRQANVKSVLFVSVNDVGRHWNASRCISGLCTPGKPPSAAMEYCAPGVKQSDVMGIVKLLTTMQMICAVSGPVSIRNVKTAPELASIRTYVAALEIESLLAVPLVEGDEHVGVLILQQTSPREWLPTDFMVLRTIADQMVLAVNNAKLRSLVKTLAVTEEKSGLLKRSSYLDVLLSEVRRSIQQSSPMSIMLMDFGKASTLVRDAGEAAVEAMMQQIGQTIAGHIRQNDVPVRYDLTRVALVLSDTNEKNSFFVVDKLRKALEGTHVPGKNTPLTMTVGIAEAVVNAQFDPVDIVTEVINRADAALDSARAEGANSVRSLAASYQATAAAS
jgi:diguanylate cyclase (GGDEF)-like protein